MNLPELLVLLGLISVAVVILGWLGHLLGFAPWLIALPVVVLGLRLLWGGRGVTAVAALAVGVVLALLAHIHWVGVVFYGALAFYVLRRYGLWRWERRERAGGH